MSKHTKGPWEVRADWIVGFNGTLHIATIPRAFDGDYSEANALLIAAAPDLLAACKDLMSFDYQRDVVCQLGLVDYCRCRKCVEKRAESAIAKAEEVKP